jgi:dTDP-4-amino-4,6-dideoxygalactose transaminase
LFLDVRDAERRVTQRTRAIMPVHYASSARGLEDVYALARAKGLRVIEDAAHAFGGTRRGLKVGAAGDVLCFSFDGIKNITSGEGGAVVTGDAGLAARLRDARLVGVERDTEARYAARRSWVFDVHHQGYRYHMSNLMAAIGRVQLRKLPGFAARRRELAARYRRALAGFNALAILDLDWDEIVPHIFVVRVRDGSRDALADHLKSRDIETGLHYFPNHALSYFASGYALPTAEKVAQEILTLPLHADLTDAEQAHVVAAIGEFFQSP